MSQRRCRFVSTLVATLIAAWGGASVQGQDLRPFTAEEKVAIAARVLRSDRVEAFATAGGERLNVLAVTVGEEPEKPDDARAVTGRRLADVIVLDYATGVASRLVVDAASGEILEVERLRGRPQSSEEEREAGRSLVRQDPGSAATLAAGGEIEGGFVVAPPAGAQAPGRFLEFHLLSAGRRRIEREVVVDLVAGRIVSSRTDREGDRP